MPIEPPVPQSDSRAATWGGRIASVILLVAVAQVLIVAFQLFRLCRAESDDLCRAGVARTMGVLPYLKVLYTGWSGRWSGVGLALVLGKYTDFRISYQWLLGAAQLTLPIAFYALLSAAFAGRLTRTARVLLTLCMMALHWSGHPHLSDAYYWLTGALENHLSLSCGLFIVAGLIRAGRVPPSRLMVAGLCLLAIVAAGLHELYSIYLSGVLLIGTAVAWRSGSPARRTWILVTVAQLIGMAINVAAPGHHHRLSTHGADHSLAQLLIISREWSRLSYHWARDLKLLLATAVLICHPASAAACPEWLRRNRGRWIAAGAAATVGILVASALFNWWAQSFMLPGRTQSVIYFLFLVGWFFTAFSAGTSPGLATQSPRPVWAVLAVCWAVSLDQGTNFRTARDDVRSGRAARSVGWSRNGID